ncbi:MAG: hypothetical protein B7X39_06555 [Lysobacterales bacterium 14-68-21]|jgi:hypothetical protein|nr:MAG: hypothetical protein B7X45_06900 [Xanthomonadales bacterium 15-68-25]OZB67002.1 MAG: hypothetical protein B7X39_06555 [Xanthomonadales bacterium 14-68-21]
MKSPIVRPSNDPSNAPLAPVPTPLQEAIGQALPQDRTVPAHRDYDGRGLLIQPLDHLDGEADCKRFMIR